MDQRLKKKKKKQCPQTSLQNQTSQNNRGIPPIT